MSILQRIVYRNFQAHEVRGIDLDPRLTCFTGPSDSGKSSLIRGLEWVALNRPPNRPIRIGAPSASVKLILDDGRSIVRRKGEDNVYLLDGEVFKFGVGGGVGPSKIPDPIKQLLNIGEDNFQGQHNSVFWLSDTAGQVSRALNEIVNLDVIDITLSNVASRLSEARTDLKVADKQYQTTKQRQDNLSWVPQMCQDLRGAEEAEETAADTRQGCTRIAAILDNARKCARTAYRAAQAVQDASEVLGIGTEIDFLATRSGRLKGLLAESRNCNNSLQTEVPDITPIQTLVVELDDKGRKCGRLYSLLCQIKAVQNNIAGLSDEASLAQKELKAFTKNENCPVCERPMPV